MNHFPVARCLCLISLLFWSFSASAQTDLNLGHGPETFRSIAVQESGKHDVTALPSFPELKTQFDLGIHLQNMGRLTEALEVYRKVIDVVTQYEKIGTGNLKAILPSKSAVLLQYGELLNRQNQPHAALPILLETRSIERELFKDSKPTEKELQSSNSFAKFSIFEAKAIRMDLLASTLYRIKDMGRNSVIYESDSFVPYEESFQELIPKVALSNLELAQTYSLLGDKEKIRETFIDFQNDLLFRLKNARINQDISIESYCARFGMILGFSGIYHEMNEAYQCALDANERLIRNHNVSPLPDINRSSHIAKRRLYLGAYVDQTLKLGGPDSKQSLVEKIALAKGLNGRFIRSIRNHINTSASVELMRLRPQLQQLEEAKISIPNDGQEALTHLRYWTASQQNVRKRIISLIPTNELYSVFDSSQNVVNLAKRKLIDASYLGFWIFRPINPITFEPLPARVLRYALTDTHIDIKDLGSYQSLETAIHQWREKAISGKESSASEISTRLLQDLPEVFYKKKSWVIDPDGSLTLLPFEVLIDDSGRKIILEHDVRYVSSLESLLTKPTPPTPINNSAVIVADPDFAEITDSTDRNASSNTRNVKILRDSKLQPLPQTREEAMSVASSLENFGVSTEIHLGKNATSDTLTFTTPPRFLHIATHGFLMVPAASHFSQSYIRVSTVLPGLQSGLIFSPGSKGNLLTGSDIATLHLKDTELVVLSACDTGNGRVDIGEGVQSLRSAIEEAGAQSSITSLWPVPNEATAQLMKTMYQLLAGGGSKSEALRRAKIELMNTAPQPIYWAGFLLAGNP